MGIGKCWKFNDNEQPPYPTIEVTVMSADRRATITPKVDTGFNGSLAIDRESVRRLSLASVGMTLVKTATGYGEASVYVVNICQPDLAIAHKTLTIGTERSLVGRRMLENRTWLLDCKKERFCIITDLSQPETSGSRSQLC